MTEVTIRVGVGDDPPAARLLYGQDVRASLRALPEASVHCVATSPPYWGLRDYGVEPSVWGGSDPACDHDWNPEVMVRKGSTNGRGDLGSTLASVGSPKTLAPGLTNDHGDRNKQYRRDCASTCSKCGAWLGQLGLEPEPDLFVEHVVEVFREVRRVLREDGSLWLNLGDSYASTGGTRTYGSFDGGVGRGPSPQVRPRGGGLKPKDLVGIPWRVALALQADGWWLRNAVVWQKANPMPSPVQDRLSNTYETVFLLTKGPRYHFDLDAIRVPHTYGEYDPDGSFVAAQTWNEDPDVVRKMDRTEGQLGTMAGPPRRFGRGLHHPGGKNRGDVWTVATQPFPGAHFACWPEALVEPMVLAGTSAGGCCVKCGAPYQRVVTRDDAQGNDAPGGGSKAEASQREREAVGVGRLDGGRRAASGSTFHNNSRKRTTPRRNFDGWQPSCSCDAGSKRCVVLDPFSGSGTTGRVATRLGQDYVGLDLNVEYLPMAISRLRDEAVPEQASGEEEGAVFDLFVEE